MKTSANDTTLLLEALARMQEEKTQLSLLVGALREENRELRESHKAEMKELRESMETAYKAENDSLKQAIETLRKTVEEMARINQIQSSQLANLMADNKLVRGKRFAPTTEQRDLLNNRQVDKRAQEKDDFDGNPPSGGLTSSPASENNTQVAPLRKKKKSEGRKPSLEDYECVDTEYHPLSDYFTLPEGARFKTRNGVIDTHAFELIELIMPKIKKHIFETATYVDSLGDAHNTLPEDERTNPVSGCPFSADLLAFVLTEKYAYHTPKKRIKLKLQNMGLNISRSTFLRYYQLAEQALRNNFEDTFRQSVIDTIYLMIDETCELVGVIDPKTGLPEYKKRYLWAFYNKLARLVLYVYENGSRAREVVDNMLADFKGAFTSDGYGAYKLFDNADIYPHITHCGCWTHARRKIIEAIGVAGEICHTLLDEISTLFHYERTYKELNLDAKDRKKKRQAQSLPVLNRIFAMVNRISKDTELMGRELLGKAIKYIQNQAQSLRNFITDGNAEISNNECEQRMRPIKLSLKNCQNIGSENAARNAAFMHSLVESCRLNNINPAGYLKMLFDKIKEPLDDLAKRALLPDRWVPQC